jgi:hypothetical protein
VRRDALTLSKKKAGTLPAFFLWRGSPREK